MRKALSVCFAVAALTLGAQSKAEAVPTLTLHICQGLTCVNFGASTLGTVTIGEYQVNATAAFFESAFGSNSQTTTINVQRVGSTSTDPLDVWLQATDYNLPTGAAFEFNTTLGTTQSFGGTGLITFQGYLSNTNGTGYAPAGSATNGLIGCNPSGGRVGSCDVVGGAITVVPGSVPFSIVTRTTYNIAAGAVYGTTGQAIVTATSIPEPGSMLLLGTGLFGVAMVARRRFKLRAR